MRLRHRVRTAASPAEVWLVLGRPARWPEFLAAVCDREAQGVRSAGAA